MLDQRFTVLIIDDSETVRRRVEKVLRGTQLFKNIVIAGDGIEGFKALLGNPVDIILCDLVMPGIDGFKFLSLKESKPEYSEVPVIMLTGEEHVRTKVRGLAAGASDYLTKPFHDEELVARVRVHLKLKALQDELREKNQRLEELSRTDALTTLCNRRYFMEQLQLEFLRAKRYGQALVYGMADVDHFKKVNDTYGHQVGDKALRGVAGLLKGAMRLHDIVGRYGGEEFGIAMPHTELDGAVLALERCRRQIESMPVETDNGQSISVTVSFGVVAYPRGDITTLEHLIGFADEALYAAKAQGRNRVVVAPIVGS